MAGAARRVGVKAHKVATQALGVAEEDLEINNKQVDKCTAKRSRDHCVSTS